MDACSQWSSVKDLLSIEDVISSSMHDTTNYLNKLYCAEAHTNVQDTTNRDTDLDIAHVINVFSASRPDYSYLHIAAPITFVSMLRAQQEAARHNISVGLFAATFAEDSSVVPIFFERLPHLNRSLS